MSRFNSNIPSVYNLISEIESNDFKSVYFLFGEDYYTINNAIKILSKKIEPLISSEFDIETINAEKKSNLSDVIDLAYTFPFGSDKKLIIVKNFENFSNKKILANYIQDISTHTILVFANYSAINSFKSEPFKSLIENNFIYESRELKGSELEGWVIKRSSQLGFKIDSENSKTLIEIVGEDKALLDMQLQKFKAYLGEVDEISTDDIKKLSSATKEYSIFDLLNALGKGKKTASLKVGYNLLDNGKDLIFILSMLTKYFSVISQAIELKNRKLSDFDAAKAIGVSKYYYINCKNASYFNSDIKIMKAINAIYKADLSLKTSSIDQKTLCSILISEIFLD